MEKETDRQRNLCDHVIVVVVAQCTRQLLIVHRWFVLALAPHLCHCLGAVQLELSVMRHPLDDFAVLSVSQQLQQKLPKLDLTVVAYSFADTCTVQCSTELVMTMWAKMINVHFPGHISRNHYLQGVQDCAYSNNRKYNLMNDNVCYKNYQITSHYIVLMSKLTLHVSIF